MRPNYRTRIRRSKLDKSENEKEKVTIPDIVKDVISMSDIVLEILDARFIEDTRNLEYEALIKNKGKKLIFIINKSDLIDKKELEEKLDLQEISPRVIISATQRMAIHKLREIIKIGAKRIKKEKVYVGVIGYPNTGKSSIINVLIGKPSARTSKEAGFTKGMQKVKLSEGIYLVDTPGVIPEKENAASREKYLLKHVKINVRTYDKIRDPEMIVDELMKKYPGKFEKFYNIEANGDSEFLLETFGKKRNFLRKGGEIDTDRTARLILKDWQEGRIKI